MNKFSFLSSPRFWKLFIVGVFAGLTTAFPGNAYILAVSVAIGTWLGGSVIVGTADKFSEANTTTTVTIPQGVSNVSATTDNNTTVN